MSSTSEPKDPASIPLPLSPREQDSSLPEVEEQKEKVVEGPIVVVASEEEDGETPVLGGGKEEGEENRLLKEKVQSLEDKLSSESHLHLLAQYVFL